MFSFDFRFLNYNFKSHNCLWSSGKNLLFCICEGSPFWVGAKPNMAFERWPFTLTQNSFFHASLFCLSSISWWTTESLLRIIFWTNIAPFYKSLHIFLKIIDIQALFHTWTHWGASNKQGCGFLQQWRAVEQKPPIILHVKYHPAHWLSSRPGFLREVDC